MPDKLYLKPDVFKKSGVHTHYSSSRPIRTNSDEKIIVQGIKFIDGVARDVPEELARQMEAEGIASRTRPKRKDDD